MLPRRELKFVTVYADSLIIVKGADHSEERDKPHCICSLEESGNELAFADVDMFRIDMITLTDEKSTTWSSFFRTFHTKVSSLHFNITVVTTWALLNIVESLCPKSLTIEFEMTEGPLRVPRLCQHRAVQKVSSLTLLNSNIFDECLDAIRIPTLHLQGDTEITGFGLQHVLAEWLTGKRAIKIYEITARGFVSPSHLFHNIPAEHVKDTDNWLIQRGKDVLCVTATGHKAAVVIPFVYVDLDNVSFMRVIQVNTLYVILMTPGVKRKSDETLDGIKIAKIHNTDDKLMNLDVTSTFCKNWFRDAKSVLILGDGNLSFSLAVAECATDIPITATVLDSENDFRTRYPSCANPEKLRKHANVNLRFSVDATALPQEWWGKFHYIIMNFPHPGGKTNLRKSRQLASAIFRGVNRIMTKETKFYLALAKGQAGVEQSE
ncbi:unnamed protein product, partial [Strongylus vulgaris]